MLVWNRPNAFTAWRGERIELNAMPSPALIRFLEAQFARLGVTKVIPERPFLEDAYRRQLRLAVAEVAAQNALRDFDVTRIHVPGDLDARIRSGVARRPDQPWDTPMAEIGRAEPRRCVGLSE